jgi:hypothetical protein
MLKTHFSSKEMHLRGKQKRKKQKAPKEKGFSLGVLLLNFS